MFDPVSGAILGAGVLGAGVSIWAADKSSEAIEGAAQISSDTQRYIFNRNTDLNKPFYDAGVSAVPGLSAYDAENPLPSYEDTVNKPMAAWDYKSSPSYDAKYTLGMGELNKQLQARGLASSGVGATRSVDLARRLTSEDYNTEWSYELGRKTDLYKSRYSENADRYNRLLDKVKMGTGASSAMGAAGNQYADAVGRNTMTAGDARSNFYSGLGGMPLQLANTGLKAYDYGKKAGWWGNPASDAAVTAAGTDAASRR